MVENNSPTATAVAKPNPWLRSSWWDLSCLAFCWVPFYLWYVFGLNIGGDIPSNPIERKIYFESFSLAVVIALGLTFVHRHYTLLLVYGDKDIFSRRVRDFILSPLLIFGLLLSAKFLNMSSFWKLVVITAGLWNVWHTIMQRHGIFRAYAGRTKSGLEQHRHGQRDLFLLWSAVAVVVCIVGLFRRPTFATFGKAKTIMKIITFMEQSGLIWIIPTVVGIVMAIAIALWIRHELKASIPIRDRVPRWSFLFSTFVLLSIFIIHGPLVGYLCFGTAHALEYLFFVHLFGEGKYGKSSRNYGVASNLFASPIKTTPYLIAGLLLLYYFMRDYRATMLYAVYYSATSLLHFLYDGWIWKVRKAEVARPLGVGA